MATLINADTSNGLKLTSDTSGIIQLQSGGTTKATVNSSGLTSPGHILQVLQSVKTDTFSTTSQTLVDVSDLSVAITPSSTSSKILVHMDLMVAVSFHVGGLQLVSCLLYTSPSPRDLSTSRMPSSA